MPACSTTARRWAQLAEFYAQTLLDSGLEFDMLFGPAYKGITLASATAVALAKKGRNVPFAYNRKEAKDHGEGGSIVGAKLQGRVVIIDDVISAGTSVRESVELIRAAGATAVRGADRARPDGAQRQRRCAVRALGGAGSQQQLRHAGDLDRQPGRLAGIHFGGRRRCATGAICGRGGSLPAALRG